MVLLTRIMQVLITVVIGLISAAIVLVASTAMAQTNVQESEIQKLTNELTEQLRPQVVVLSRDISVYHYFPLKPGNYEGVRINDPFFTRYAIMGMSSFWRREWPNPKGMAGWGLYAALDPFVTNYFGNTLLEITISAGSRILKENLLEKVMHKTFQKNLSHARMTQILREVAKRLNVVGFTYGYGSSPFVVCNSVKQEAFVLFGIPNEKSIATMKGISVVGYVQKIARSSEIEKRQYQRIVNFVQSQKKLSYSGKPIFAGEFTAPTDEEKAYWQNRIYSCDNRYPEDK